jgi:hypothetical protein
MQYAFGIYMNLEDYLTDKDLRTALQSVKDHCSAIWVQGLYPAPWTVIHGVPHSEAVATLLGRLLEVYMTKPYKLNQGETLVLLGAAWLHDVGYLPKGRENKGNYDFDEVKKNHPVRGYDYIMSHISECGGKHWAPLIALCVRGHREVPQNEGEYANRVAKSYKIRLQFLTALLRLADELDIGEDRAPRPFFTQIKEFYGSLPAHTILQWIRHYYTEAVDLQHEAKNGAHIHIGIHTYIPSEEYEKYVVEPWIIEPVKTAVLDTFHALSTEYLTLDTNVTSKYQTVASMEVIPHNVFSYFQKQVLDRESLQSLVRYNFKRVCEFQGETGQKDHVFNSMIIKTRNSLSYALVNNSNDRRYLTGNGSLLGLSTDIFEAKPGQKITKENVEEKTGTTVQITRNGKPKKIRIRYFETQTLSDLEKMSISQICGKYLSAIKTFSDKVFGFYQLKEDKGVKTVAIKYLFLEPMQPKEELQFEYSWNSTFLPWDVVTITLSHPTKGVSISFESFPDSYVFRTTVSLLREVGARPGQERKPEFFVESGNKARCFADSGVIAPGTQIVAQWRDANTRLEGI